jgi:hypothetical protein
MKMEETSFFSGPHANCKLTMRSPLSTPACPCPGLPAHHQPTYNHVQDSKLYYACRVEFLAEQVRRLLSRALGKGAGAAVDARQRAFWELPGPAPGFATG